MMEGVNSTMTHCKNFCECHKVPPAQQYFKKYFFGAWDLSPPIIRFILAPSSTDGENLSSEPIFPHL
jgi:hypothetical protein